MKETKQRESNIELLRIISMLLIIVYHFVGYVIAPNSPELKYLTQPLVSLLHIGVICFLLISGYWGIKFSLQGLIRLFVYCSLYSIFIYIVGVLLNPQLFSLKNSIASLLPNQWWFIPVYLCLFILTPLINIPLEERSKQAKILFIIILGIISFGFGQLIPSLQGGKNPINFVLIYYIGNFLRTGLVIPETLRPKKLLLIYLTFNAFLFFAMMIATIYVSVVGNVIFKLFFPYNSLGLIVNSSLFFLLFIKLKVTSKIVNWLASSSLSVYLIHENKYISYYLYGFVSQLQNHIENVLLFSIAIIILAMLVFSIAVIIDKILSPLFQFIIEKIINIPVVIKVDRHLKTILEQSSLKQIDY